MRWKSFLKGMISIFNLFGIKDYSYNRRPLRWSTRVQSKSDWEKLNQDQRKVAGDMSRAIAKLEEESRREET